MLGVMHAQARKPAEAALLRPCFDKYVERILAFVR
jgi:hypothetical protein